MSNASNADFPCELALVGAGGFVGSRLLQMNAASGRLRVLPILRSYRGLARLGLALPHARVIDTTQASTLSLSLKGVETVVNLTMGDDTRILDDVKTLHSACRQAGVARLIHLSSAVVFGRAIRPEIPEDARPDTRSWMLYARGKAKAEEWLRHQFHDEHLQVVVLRPGLIWGPGSVWSEMVGQQLQHGTVLLLNGGRGVANLVYVDNLVRIILAVASHPAKNGSGFFNVADLNPVTWRDYYAGLATRLGYSADAVRLCADSRLKIRPQHLVEWALQQQSLLRMAKRLWKQLGAGTRVRIKAKLRPSPGPPEQGPGSPGPPPLSREHWALQNTLYPLPSSKIHRDYGPIELIQFPEALDRTASWLRYAGFAARTANTKAHASAAFV